MPSKKEFKTTEMPIYCFDLDDTICRPRHNAHNSHEKYAQADPNPEIIERVRAIHKSGHTVIIHTARRMLTHKGDLAKIENDVGEITRSWLFRHSVPYDQLIFGKPYADYYIDDKAVLPQELAGILP